MMIGHLGRNPSPLGADNEAFFDKEWLIDLLESALILTDGGGYGVGPDRTTFECGDDRAENLVVYGVQSPLVNLQFVKGGIC